MLKRILILLFVCQFFFLVINPLNAQQQPKNTKTALELHHDSILIDGHNDLIHQIHKWQLKHDQLIDLRKKSPWLHTDIPKMKQGGVDGQFWAAYVPCYTMENKQSYRIAVNRINLIKKIMRQYPDVFNLVATSDLLKATVKEGKIAAMIGVEGGHAIEGSLYKLTKLYERGVRYMTLTHNCTNEWADSATDQPLHNGLNKFGEKVISRMNDLGMIVDISHVSDDTMRDVLKVSKAPVIASHSGAAGIYYHPRNIPDDVLVKLKQNGGMVMVVFYPGFIKGFGNGSVHTVVDHIEHIVKVAGIDHVGIGSDFDGIGRVPAQLKDVSEFPNLTKILVKRGYRDEDIRKILGLNFLRVMKQVEVIAEKSK